MKPSSWPGRKYIHPSARPLPSLAVRLEAVSRVFSRNQGEPSCQSQVLEARPLDHIAHPAVPATPRRRRQIIDAVPSGLRNGRLVVRTAHVTQPHASSSRSDPQSDGLDSRPTKNRWSQRAEGPETTLLKLKAHCLCFLQIADFTSRGSRSLLDSLNTAPSLRPCNPPACSAQGPGRYFARIRS